ncbi:TonB-dependent receptor plug domain-containing protein, partial [Rhizobium ruizarguesonis]
TIVAKDTATGTKTDTPVVDVPASVSVVTQKELEERHVDNLQQAVAYTAGVFSDEFGNDDRSICFGACGGILGNDGAI